MISQDNRPAPLDSARRADDDLADFRVDEPRELLALLRQLRDAVTPLHLNGPGGSALTATLWTLDDANHRLSFSADDSHPQLQRMVGNDEAVAVAYLDSVKLQFDLRGLLLVRGHAGTCALQAQMPTEIYRFQRRGAYRVRTPERGGPTARLRHPSMPEMALALRVLDVSIGGCALFLPDDVPPLQPGVRLSAVQIDLDADTHFQTTLTLQHVGTTQQDESGLRIGCEWPPLGGNAERALQRYIDQTQKRARLLADGGGGGG